MKSHTRFRKAASILIAFILVLTMAPMAVFAAVDEPIYSDSVRGITISVQNGHDALILKKINFKVVVDSETVVESYQVEVPLASTEIHIEAEGYTVTFDTTNAMTVSG